MLFVITKLCDKNAMWILLPVFAIGETYVTLLIARAVQGVASACIGVCGMSLVAQVSSERCLINTKEKQSFYGSV